MELDISVAAADDCRQPASKQSKGNPIPDTVQWIKGYPLTLKLCHVHGSPFWYVTLYRQGKKLKASTGSEKLSEATSVAKKWFEEILLKEADHLPLTKTTSFQRIAMDLFKEDALLVSRGELAARTVSERKRIYTTDLLPFFSKDNIKDIRYARLQAYQQHLATRGKKPVSSNTVKIHFSHLSKIFTHAIKLGVTDHSPQFPKVSSQRNPRSWFSEEQLDLLLKVMFEEINKGTKVRNLPITDELHDLTMFLLLTFLRPSDLTNLQHKHIEIVPREGKEPYLRITTAHSKTVKTPVISMPVAVYVYKDLKEVQEKRGFTTEPDDYVFMPQFKTKRSHAQSMMGRQFDHVLVKAGLKISQTGGRRTLYSLRHTAISQALMEGVQSPWIAKNCRTSLQMIDDFYTKHLSVELNLDRLHNPLGKSDETPF